MRRNQRGYRKNKKNNHELQDRKFIKTLSISVLVLIVLLVFISIIYAICQAIEHNKFLKSVNEELEQAKSEISDVQEEPKKEEKTDISFTLTAIGDIMCHNTQYMDAFNSETNEYDFSYVFKEISNYTKLGDIAIGSLETSFAGSAKGYSNYPTFNSPDSLAYDLKKIGIDVLSTAGNHCLDMGFPGLSRTIDVLDDADISHLGTYKSQEDRDTILVKNVKGANIAFINYTYGTNGIPIPSGQEFCVNLIDKELIKSDIAKAKEQNVDLIVACMHWGTEYLTTANQEQEELADFLFQNGVDIILGNHPHVLEPMKKKTITLEDGTTKDVFVIYALGNFICDQNAENTRNSIILNLKMTKHIDNKITIDKVDYVPIYMYKDNSSGVQKMRLLDIQKNIDNYEIDINNGVKPVISQSLYNNLKIQLEKIKKIVEPNEI